MTTATVEERVQEDRYDVFRHFEGGREGVRKRFGDLIQKGLEGYSFKDVMGLCEEIKFDPKNLYEIIKGNYESLNPRLVEDLAYACSFTYDQALGEFLISPGDVPEILARVRKEKFCVPVPAGVTLDNPDETICRLYLLCKASDQL